MKRCGDEIGRSLRHHTHTCNANCGILYKNINLIEMYWKYKYRREGL